LSENKFNVYDSKENPILLHAEAILNPERPSEFLIRTDTEQFRVPYLKDSANNIHCLDTEGAPLKLTLKTEQLQSELSGSDLVKADFVKSPMPGTVVKVYCQVGQHIKKGEAVVSVESMKMEFLIRATHDVKVKEIRAVEGKFVQMGEQLVIFEKEEEAPAAKE
jgi:acetyl-CoA carboxylase biotin carboxyl carrier protein